MKVRELIEQLTRYDLDAEVYMVTNTTDFNKEGDSYIKTYGIHEIHEHTEYGDDWSSDDVQIVELITEEDSI